MRLAIVACLLQSAFTKQADTLLLREDQCDDALFVAHWTHVPKAGCPVPLTVRGTQALVSFAPLAFKLLERAE